MQRVVVVGTSCSGKTTVGACISERLGLPHVELDSIHWAPNWTEIPNEEFREKVAKVTERDSWVVDGNYRVIRDILWGRADTIVWLDLPFRIVFWRSIKRTVTRIITGKELWNGNVEHWDALLGPEGMPKWVIKTYWKRKKEFPELFASPEYSHLEVVHLRTQAEIDTWLGNLGV
ncbi:MAG: adenylate kinase [Candidatus Bathyarchaeota archaeon]|nr:adenylate kinase [Candidatus Bathyarchaeota archaeon]